MNISDYRYLDILKTSRCTLRYVSLSDAPSILHLYSNPKVIRYTEHHYPMQNLSEAEYAIDFYRRGYDEGWMYRWGIILNESNRLIGTAGLHRINHDHKFTNIGYEINSPYWNKGISTEVVKVLTEYGFQTFDLHRIEAELIPQNIGSARVVQKNGYQYEATRKQRLRKHTQYYDIDVYGILRNEWKALYQ